MSDRIYCTITTKSHLAQARVLTTSLLEHEPEAVVYVLLADRVDGCFDPSSEPFKLIQLDELDKQSEVRSMAFYYRQHEFCWGLKARLHEHMLKRLQVYSWVFLDADIVVYDRLDPVWEQLGETSILLSNHLNYANSMSQPSGRSIVKLENYMLYSGVFNGGLVGFSAGAETEAFIDWWRDRLRFYSFEKRPAQFGDQYWLPMAFSFFDSVSVIRHPGANVAFWNLFEREVTQGPDGKLLVDGEPLLFYHFAGFDRTRPRKLTRYGIPKGLGDYPEVVLDLAEDYSRRLAASGDREARKFPHAFSKFTSGESITREMRQLYFAELVSGSYSGKDSPFDDAGYIKSRLRRKNLRSILGRLGRWLVNRVRRLLNPEHDFEISEWGWD